MDYSTRHDNYVWKETPFADIELHINAQGECWLRIKSFNPSRSNQFIRDNRGKHDQVLDLDLTPIDPWTMKAKYDLTLKLNADEQTAGYLLIPGVAKLRHWRDDFGRKSETYVCSTYFNQCDYYGDGVKHDVPDPYEEIVAQEEFSTMGQVAALLARMGGTS